MTRRLEQNRQPVSPSSVAFEVPERELLTEGIAYDPKTEAFYVSSVRRGQILRVDKGGAVTRLAPDEPAHWAALGLRVDAKRQALWAASTSMPQTTGHVPADSGRSGVLRYDLRTGKLAKRYDVPADSTPHALGDLIVTRAGDVYATDSRAPVLWRIPAKGDTLERFLESPLFLSAQGLALTPDERTLYVADYARGLLRVDLQARTVTPLEAADSVLPLGIDGLYWRDGKLIGIQNGVQPHRVSRFTLSKAGDRVIRGEILERAHPRYNEPTLGVLVGDALYYVANSQWERFGEDGRIAEPDELQPHGGASLAALTPFRGGIRLPQLSRPVTILPPRAHASQGISSLQVRSISISRQRTRTRSSPTWSACSAWTHAPERRCCGCCSGARASARPGWAAASRSPTAARWSPTASASPTAAPARASSFRRSTASRCIHVFLIVAPPLEISNQYLPVLGRIAQFAKEANIPERLAALTHPDEFFQLLEEKGV